MANNIFLPITISDLCASKSGIKTIDHLSIIIQTSLKTVILGETGSGKTSLLRLMAGLEQADSGVLFYGENRIKGADEQLIPGHPFIAYLSQYSDLRNNYRVQELLDYDNQLPIQEAKEIYRICDILHLTDRWSDELSGGEKQRVAIAKMITKKPKVILLDEPFAHLDYFHKQTIKDLLDSIIATLNIGCVLVTHDARDVLGWAEEIHVIRNGKLVQTGKPEELYHCPTNKYVAGMLGDFSLIKYDPELFTTAEHVIPPASSLILLRPSYFKIDSVEGIPVQIKKIVFKGDHIELLVVKNEQSVKLSTSFNDNLPNNIRIKYSRKILHWITD